MSKTRINDRVTRAGQRPQTLSDISPPARRPALTRQFRQADPNYVQLSAEIFERIVDALEVDLPERTTAEKRQEPRTAVHGSVSVVPPGGGPPLRVEVRDISRHGIGILSKRKMAAGEEFVLLVAGDAGAVGVIFSVAHCRAVSPDQYAIGARVVRFSLRA